MHVYGIELKYTDEETSFGDVVPSDILDGYKEDFFARSPYSFEIPCVPYCDAIVEYFEEPVVSSNMDFKVKIRIRNNVQNCYYFDVAVALPEGWTADYNRSCFVRFDPQLYTDGAVWEMTVHVGENVSSVNRISVMMSPDFCPIPLTVPVTLLG